MITRMVVIASSGRKRSVDGHVIASTLLLSCHLGRIHQLAIPECLRDTSDTLDSLEATVFA
jgi:hypothetical protein